MATENVYIKYYPDTSAFEAALRRYEARVARLQTALQGAGRGGGAGGAGDAHAAAIATEPGQTRIGVAPFPRGGMPSPTFTTFGPPDSSPHIVVHRSDATARAAAARAVHASLASKLALGASTAMDGAPLPALPPPARVPALTIDPATGLIVRRSGPRQTASQGRMPPPWTMWDPPSGRVIDAEFTSRESGAGQARSASAQGQRAQARTAGGRSRPVASVRKLAEVATQFGFTTPALLSTSGLLTAYILSSRGAYEAMVSDAITGRDRGVGGQLWEGAKGVFRAIGPGVAAMAANIAATAQTAAIFSRTGPLDGQQRRAINWFWANFGQSPMAYLKQQGINIPFTDSIQARSPMLDTLRDTVLKAREIASREARRIPEPSGMFRFPGRAVDNEKSLARALAVPYQERAIREHIESQLGDK